MRSSFGKGALGPSIPHQRQATGPAAEERLGLLRTQTPTTWRSWAYVLAPVL